MPGNDTRITPCIAGCGKQVPYRTNAKVFCEECRATIRSERQRVTAERRRRARGVAKIKGTECKCSSCGTVFVRHGIKKHRCDPCQKVALAETARASSRARTSDPRRRDIQNAWFRNKTATCPKFAISQRMKTLIWRDLGRGKAGRSWKEFVDYTLDELIYHIERQFLPGMTWDNRGEWHIDHIVPLSSFKFSSADDIEFKRAWALSNLRPLWALDNIRKQATRTHLI